MSSANRACPKCGSAMIVPQPVPEVLTCPGCKQMFKVSPPRKPVSGAMPAVAQAVAVPVGSGGVPAPKKMVAGHEVQRELARGGLGIVYLAYHPHLADFR